MRKLLRLGLLLCLVAPVLVAQGQSGDPAPPDAQRVELLDRMGGLVTASVSLPDGSLLIAEGSALVRFDPAGEGQIIARQDLGQGVILDLAEAFPFYYALTEKGFLILGAGGESNTPQRLSFTPGGGQAFAVREGLIAIAAREEGLRLLQVESPGNARLLATLALPGEALDVALDADGTRVYVAGGDGGVLAVDIADPAEPHLIGSLPEIATAETVAMAGSLLAVGSRGQVLLIDPSSAAGRVGLYAPLHRGRRLTIRDDYAYIADAAGGLKIIWLAAPDRPVQVYGEADRPAYDVQVEGDVAYVAEAGGLRILDVGNRYRPLEVSRLALPGQPQSVTLAPGRAFVALGEEGIAIVDTANLSEPRLIGRIRLAGTARATVFYGGYLYAAVDEAGLAVIEASRPGGETLLATLSLAGPALDVERRGRALYVAAGEAGLLAVDITRPERPALVGTLPPEPGHEMLSLSISGKRAYVADGEGFSVVDINQPARIGRLTYVQTPAIHMGLSGVYVYALSDDRITVYDARATAEPVYLRTYAALRRLSSIQVLDDRLFLTSMGEGPDVVALSIAAPDYPVELDNVGSTGHTYHARPAAGSLWLAAGYGGLRRYDLSEGGALIPRGGYGTPPDIARLALAGDRLLVGGRSGWALLGLAEGGSPRLIEQADRSVTVRGLALKDGAFAFSTDEPGIALYTPEDGGSPPSLLRRETSGPVVGLALDDEYLYAAGPEGLSIYERRYLQPVMYIRTPAPATGLALAGGLAYLSLADGNLAVVDVSSPGSGIALLDSLGTRRPTDLIPGPDGATIYGLADETISRLQVSSRDRFYVSRSGQLPAPAERGVFVGNLLGAFVPGGGTLSLYDLTFMDENVIPRGEIEMQGEALLVDGGLAFVAYGEEGLGVIDLTASGAGTIFHPEETHAVYRMGETLFALGSSLTAWDITRPAAPRLLATLPLLAPGTHIDPAPGGRLLLSLANGLSLIGWDGEEFTPIGHLTTVSAVDRAAQLGDRAYLALHSGGLLVADLSDPHNPEALFTYVSPSGQFVYDLLPLDESRLLVSWEGGVDLLEVETNTPDPDAAPRLLNVTPTGGGQALDIALSPDGALAALALGDDGAVLLSLADPRNPQVLGYASTPGDGLRAALDGETLYLADGVCGLRVFDLADPTAPQEVGYWSGDYASDVTVGAGPDGERLLYLADANRLLTLRYDPAAPPLSPPVPQSPDPADGAGEVPLNLTLSWSPPPDPCNPLIYDVYLGVATEPAFIGQVGDTPELEVSDLQPARTYYWRVEVTDRQGDRVRGPVWRFTTVSASFVDTLPPAPPPFLRRIQEAPLPIGGLAFLLIAALGGGLYWRRRRRRRTRQADPEWYGPDDGETTGPPDG